MTRESRGESTRPHTHTHREGKPSLNFNPVSRDAVQTAASRVPAREAQNETDYTGPSFGTCRYCAKQHVVLWWTGRRYICRPCFTEAMGGEPDA